MFVQETPNTRISKLPTTYHPSLAGDLRNSLWVRRRKDWYCARATPPMLLMSGCLARHPEPSLSRSSLPPSTPGPSQRRVLPTLHRTARATSCPLQLPSEDGPAQCSWVWMGCAEAGVLLEPLVLGLLCNG